MTTTQSPVAAMTAPVAATGSTLTDMDRSALDRLLADRDDMVALLTKLRESHLMDAGGPLFESFTRLGVCLEMDGIEIRHIRNLLGGRQ